MFAVGGLVVVAIAMSMVDVIPASVITPGAMGETSIRVGLYFERSRRLPTNLDAIPKRPGYWNRTTDGWDRPLRYTVDAEDAFTLSSLGRDDKAGGVGDDADTIQHYRIERGEVRPVP